MAIGTSKVSAKASGPHPFSTRRGAAFRMRILERDLFTCQMCGSVVMPGKASPQSAVVDHREPLELAPDKAFDPDNLVTCCKSCDHQINRGIENKARRLGLWSARGAQWIAAEKRRYRFVGVDGSTS